MDIRVLIAILAMLLTGCAKRVSTLNVERDSVVVEVRERVEYRVDTVSISIPYMFSERETRDTSSYLENEYAMSLAYTSDGVLSHSLSTKPQLRNINLNRPVVYRDSIVYRNFYRDITTEIERELTFLQRVQIKGFWVLLILLLFISILHRIGRK